MIDLTEGFTPWGATVDGALQLLPDAVLIANPEPGRVGVTVVAAEQWVEDVSRRVARRLSRWQQLPTAPVAPEVDSDRDQLVADARDLVHQAVASYIEAARRPGTTANEASYAAVLWRRYTTGLDELATWLDELLEAAAAGEGGAGAPGEQTPKRSPSSFPAPTFTDALRW